MTRRREKWCVPGYRASQRGWPFSSRVALTPQSARSPAPSSGAKWPPPNREPVLVGVTYPRGADGVGPPCIRQQPFGIAEAGVNNAW